MTDTLPIRRSAWDGSFYPADPKELHGLIAELTKQATTPANEIPQGKLRALVMPHAGYIYSGFTAAHTHLVLDDNEFSKVIVMAPDHRVGFIGGAISAASAYQTPLGNIPVMNAAHKLREKHPALFQANIRSDQAEHSLEVELPFLQTYLGDFSLIPIVLSAVEADVVADAIEPYLDEDTLLVASSDLSHFLQYEDAVYRDRQTLMDILEMNAQPLMENDNKACGMKPIQVILEFARKQNWQPTLLHYSNSGDTAGDHDRVVGYATIAFIEAI